MISILFEHTQYKYAIYTHTHAIQVLFSLSQLANNKGVILFYKI